VAVTAATFDDLRPEVLADVLGERPVRSYPALLATGPDAAAWARANGPHGAVVVADYQASPRGRAGIEWMTAPGLGLGFSLLLRPQGLPSEREGWLYPVVTTALSDVLGPDTGVEWPDTVVASGRRVAATGVQVESGASALVRWVVATVLVDAAEPPRAPLLATLLSAVEGRLADGADEVLARARERCATVGRRVRARLIPMGPDGVEVVGEAVDLRPDGSLVIVDASGRRIAVPPQVLGRLDDAEPG
jgi:BirA family biotin operon repressor/biotin-[acetyl-CoA-carboxylase] ligase